MSKTSPISTVIDASVKEAVAAFCRMRGLKMRYLIEQALTEYIEDAVDLEAYHERRHEETVDFEKFLADRKKKKK